MRWRARASSGRARGRARGDDDDDDDAMKMRMMKMKMKVTAVGRRARRRGAPSFERNTRNDENYAFLAPTRLSKTTTRTTTCVD